VLSWSLASSDPLQNKADALVSYCFPDASVLDGSNEAQNLRSLKTILTSDNLKHFVDQYKNFHTHWPMLHLPTFDLVNANNGLLLVIVCIGAVYSERVSVHQVRWLMDVAKGSVQRSSQIYNIVAQARSLSGQSDPNSPSDIEEVAALCLLHALFSWHGTPVQRQESRNEFWILVRIARHLSLTSVIAKDQPGSSVLHRSGSLTREDMEGWSWNTWIEQEKRVRVFYLIFLLDVALGLFFNCAPNFEVSEIKLPLPTDDAAWEARTQDECIAALGLRGEAAQTKNNTGSRRAKQIGFSEVLQYLQKGLEYQPRSTNAYGKFIIIHAIHNQMLQNQRYFHAQKFNNMNGNGSGANGHNNQKNHYQQRLLGFNNTLENWKKAWDMDQQLQYPPAQRRAGYCRDAIHYYFLGKMLIRMGKLEDLQLAPDERCRQIFACLKQIKNLVATEQEKKGLDIGAVTNVNDNYGMEELTLDMKLLFTPVNDFAD